MAADSGTTPIPTPASVSYTHLDVYKRQILLLDEPLAALDSKRKQEILPYLERLHRELAIPVIYVSHSPDEVARLADHLVLLDQGKVIVSGPLNSCLLYTSRCV